MLKTAEGGALGGVVTMVVTPVLYAKNMKMIRQQFVAANCIRGITLNGASVVPATAIALGVLELTDNPVLAGAMAGAVSVVPENIVQNMQAAEKKLSAKHVMQRAIANGGYKSLFRGSLAAMGREAIYVTSYAKVMDHISSELQQHVANKEIADVLSAIVTGGAVGAITTPMDAWRAQKQEDVMTRKHTMPYKQIIKKLGVAGMFRGVAERSAAVIAAVYMINKGRKLLAGEPSEPQGRETPVNRVT